MLFRSSDTGTNDSGLSDAIKSVQSSIKDLNSSIVELQKTATTAVVETIATAKTVETLSTATTAAFQSAGFGPTKQNFTKA